MSKANHDNKCIVLLNYSYIHKYLNACNRYKDKVIMRSCTNYDFYIELMLQVIKTDTFVNSIESGA